jgi:hypothetical protein
MRREGISYADYNEGGILVNKHMSGPRVLAGYLKHFVGANGSELYPAGSRVSAQEEPP